MDNVLNRNLLVVRGYDSIIKTSIKSEIYDPDTNELLLLGTEKNLKFFLRLMKFSYTKENFTFQNETETPRDDVTIYLKSNYVSLFLSRFDVLNVKQQIIAKFKQKFFSFGGNYELLDPKGNVLFTLKGNWSSLDFKFVKGEIVYSQVSKKTKGFIKELSTWEDTYLIEFNQNVNIDSNLRLLILVATLCIGVNLKK